MYEIEFQIPGLPKTINGLSGKSYHVVRKDRLKFKNLVWMAVREKLPRAPLKSAKLICVRGSSVAPDYDNLVSSFKAPIDGLVEAGVIEDDNLGVIGVPSFHWEKAKKGHGYIRIRVLEQ